MSAAPVESTPGTVPVKVGVYAWYIACILGAAHLVSFLDRFVMSLALVPLKAEMGLSDTQLGLLGGIGFVLLYTLVAIPLGLLADRVNRRNLIAVGIFFWSLATAACAFAESFNSLFAARVAVGLGEAALVPAAMSLFAAYFTRDKLGRAVSIFTMGAGWGRTVAYVGGGAILAALANVTLLQIPVLGAFRPWQVLFLAAAVPGFVLTVVVMLTVREPKRPPLTGAAAKPGFAPAWAHFRAFPKAFLLHVLAACSCIAVVQTVSLWAPSFFVRAHGFSAGDSGYIVGTLALLAGSSGGLFGGYITDRRQARGVAGAPGVTMTIGLLASVPFGLLWYFAGSSTWSIIGFAGLEFFISGTAPAGLAGVQMLTPPRLRGVISSVFLCLVTLFSVGMGPASIGLLTDHVFGAGGLGGAMLSSQLLFTVLGVTAALLGRRLFQATVNSVAAEEQGRG